MVTRIVYDTEFIDNGVTIEPMSIAMRREDGAELYAVTNKLETMARAAEHDWLRENVLKWLPVTVKLAANYGKIDAHVEWDAAHPDYGAVNSLTDIAEMVEDFVTKNRDVELWADYAAYDHVLMAQLFGPMSELPAGIPMFTMDLQHERAMCATGEFPLLPEHIVTERFGGTRMTHHALYDACEEAFQLKWLLGSDADRGAAFDTP